MKEYISTDKGSVTFNSFVRRQTKESGFSHWEITESVLLQRIKDGIPNAKQGYRKGVLLVPVRSEGFFTSEINLKEGDVTTGIFEPRREGETPRMRIGVVSGGKTPAEFVTVVLYSHELLTEDGDAETSCDFEVISVNASLSEDPPMDPLTLMANHFHDSGGTATNMTDADFVTELKRSYDYWRTKGLVASNDDMLKAIPELNRAVDWG